MDKNSIQGYMKEGMIRRYNRWCSKHFKFTQDNFSAAEAILLEAEGYQAVIDALYNFLQYSKHARKDDFVRDCRELRRGGVAYWAKYDPASAATPVTTSNANEPKKEVSTMAQTTNLNSAETAAPASDSEILRVLSEALKSAVGSINVSGLEEQLKQHVVQFIKDTYGPIERTTTLIINGNKTQIKGIVHEKFDSVLNAVAMGIPVFLTGPAGSGKNVLCGQIAEALGLKFYFSNAVSQEYKLTGFTDANGVFQETQFFKAFRDGGLFMLDEMDASNPEVLTILNAAIANRYFDFAAPIGYVKAHPNFRVIAAGNTYGNGADYDYVGRTQLDAATLNRFVTIPIGYDPRIEEQCAGNDRELLGFCRAFRDACQKNGIHTVVSYRNIQYLAQLEPVFSSTKELLEACLVKGLDKADLQMLSPDLKGFGKYSDAVNAML